MDSRKSQSPEPGGESSQLDRPTGRYKGKGREIAEREIEEIDRPSKRRKVEGGPAHAYRELEYRCREMTLEDFDKVYSNARDALIAGQAQARKDFDSEGWQKLAQPLNDKISAYDKSLSFLRQTRDAKRDEDNIREKMLNLIESGRDIKTRQARGPREQQIDVNENGTVKAAEALEDAILDLTNQYRHENERLKDRVNKLKSDHMILETKNEKLAQNFIIKDMNSFLTHLRRCGQQFYGISIVRHNRDVQIALKTYKSVKNKSKSVMMYLGFLRLENGTPKLISKNGFGFGVNLEAWSQLAQDMRLLAGIHAERKVDGVEEADGGPEARKKTTVRIEFHFASPFRKENLWDEKDNRMTLMAREAIQLLASGYEIRNRNSELNEGNAGVKSLENYAYKTYPYAICVDVVKAQMASLSNFKEAVEMYEVKRDEKETDENFKRRIKETKEALWELFSSVLEPEKDKGVVAEASQAMASQS